MQSDLVSPSGVSQPALPPVRRFTTADLLGLKLRCIAMLDYARSEHGRMYEVHSLPRLQVLDRFRSRGPKSSTRTFLVDGQAVETLDEAVALLNGEALPPKEEPVAKPKPISLAQQIEELERERDRRKAVGARGSSKSLEEYQLARLEAADRRLPRERSGDLAQPAAGLRPVARAGGARADARAY